MSVMLSRCADITVMDVSALFWAAAWLGVCMYDDDVCGASNELGPCLIVLPRLATPPSNTYIHDLKQQRPSVR